MSSNLVTKGRVMSRDWRAFVTHVSECLCAISFFVVSYFSQKRPYAKMPYNTLKNYETNEINLLYMSKEIEKRQKHVIRRIGEPRGFMLIRISRRSIDRRPQRA